jgi:hypothetical protein
MYNLTHLEMSLFKLTDWTVSILHSRNTYIDWHQSFSLRVIVGAGHLSALTNIEHVEFTELRSTIRWTASRRSPSSQHETRRQLLDIVTRVNGHHDCHTRVLWKVLGLTMKKRIYNLFLFFNIISLKTNTFIPGKLQRHYPVPDAVLRKICKIPLYSCNRLFIRRKTVTSEEEFQFW